MPIRIQYGPTGLLGEAAAAVGEGQRLQREQQRYDQQVARDMEFLNQEMGRRQQARQQDLRNQLEYAKLAQQARRQPTSAPARRRSTFADRVRQDRDRRREETPTAVPGTLQSEQQGTGYIENAAGERFEIGDEGQVVGTRDGEDIPQEEVQRRGGYVTSGQRQQQADPMTTAKQAYAEAIGANRLPDRQRQAMEQLVANPEVDLSQFRMAASRALQAGQQQQQGGAQLSPAQRAQMQVHTLGREQEQLQEQVQQMAQAFTPEEQQMTVREYEQHARQQLDTQSIFNPMDWADDPVFTTEEEVNRAVQRFRRMKELQGDLNTVRQRRNQMIGLGAGGEAPGGGEDLPTVNSDEEFDALPSGARFRDPQGNIRRKP